MTNDEPELFRAFRKGRLRIDIPLALLKHGPMHVPMIAALCRTEAKLVHWAIVGKRRKFRGRLSLASLGIVRVVRRSGGPTVELTAKGRVWAEKLARGWRPW